MKKRILAILFMLMIVPALCFAQSATVSYDKTRIVDKLTIAWTSDASGDVTKTTVIITGVIGRVCTVPSGTAAPTADYDITLVDDNGVDVLQGGGADRHTSTTECFTPLIDDANGADTMPVFISDKLDLTVANAGNAKSGEIILWIK